jgi:hypothetical protein
VVVQAQTWRHRRCIYHVSRGDIVLDTVSMRGWPHRGYHHSRRSARGNVIRSVTSARRVGEGRSAVCIPVRGVCGLHSDTQQWCSGLDMGRIRDGNDTVCTWDVRGAEASYHGDARQVQPCTQDTVTHRHSMACLSTKSARWKLRGVLMARDRAKAPSEDV